MDAGMDVRVHASSPGLLHSRRAGPRGLGPSATWRARGDFDGNATADLAVGAPGAHHGAGRVAVFERGREIAAWEGTSTGALLGASVASAGDVNGDGRGDVLAGAPGAGRAYWIAGGNGRTMTAVELRAVANAGPSARFGEAVVGAGDVNGDGFDDVAVGAPGDGRVEVFYGGPRGPGAHGAVTLWSREGAGSRFGAALAGGADADGDGYADLVVGSPGVRAGAGRIALYLGSAAGIATTPAVDLAGPDGRYGEFGAAILLADLDGDGFADLAVGSPGAHGDTGRVRVYFGGRYGVVTEPGLVIEGPNVMDPEFGRALAAVPDAEGDCPTALLAGAPGAFDSDGWAGLFASRAGASSSEPVRAWGNSDGLARRMGASLASGDLDGDGRVDVVIAGDTRASVFPAGSAVAAGGVVALGEGDGPIAVAVVGGGP